MIQVDVTDLDIGDGPAPLAYLCLAVLCASLGIGVEVVEDGLYSESLVFHHLPTDTTLAVISEIDGLSGALLLTVMRQIGDQLSGEDDDEDEDDDDWLE